MSYPDYPGYSYGREEYSQAMPGYSATYQTNELSPPRIQKRKGSRSVSTLTASQLARKRQNDREAQRAIRARTKEHIDSLEAEVKAVKSKLESSSSAQKMEALIKENKYLESELALYRSGAAHSRPYQTYMGSTFDSTLATPRTNPSNDMPTHATSQPAMPLRTTPSQTSYLGTSGTDVTEAWASLPGAMNSGDTSPVTTSSLDSRYFLQAPSLTASAGNTSDYSNASRRFSVPSVPMKSSLHAPTSANNMYSGDMRFPTVNPDTRFSSAHTTSNQAVVPQDYATIAPWVTAPTPMPASLVGASQQQNQNLGSSYVRAMQ